MGVTGLLVFLTGFVIVFGVPNVVKSSGGKKYEAVLADPLNWYAAYQYCRRQGRQLATITSQVENDGLITELNKARGSLGIDHCYWIGLTSLANFNYWYWMTSGEPLLDFKAWDNNQPAVHNDYRRCVHTNYKSDTSWFWRTTSCTEMCYFVCEYQA
uniref:C-type lectin domain-containing protein n=1 Tax=Cuerna arida TaxID=1464854 RepID=A0A1B6ERC2_9HEMI